MGGVSISSLSHFTVFLRPSNERLKFEVKLCRKENRKNLFYGHDMQLLFLSVVFMFELLSSFVNNLAVSVRLDVNTRKQSSCFSQL